MLNYILKRVLSGVVTVWFIATATFMAMHAVPGDPLSSEKEVSPEIRKNLEKKYGLDKPVISRPVIIATVLIPGAIILITVIYGFLPPNGGW